jgi:hypothetical protein
MQAGRLPDAIAHFSEALRLQLNYADVHSNLAAAEKLLKRYRQDCEASLAQEVLSSACAVVRLTDKQPSIV